MNISRPWAFWRQVQYGSGFSAVLLLIGYGFYSNYLYVPPNCFDTEQNGGELGIDCGGSCTRICAFSALAPSVEWARSFKVTDGQYNAVAFVNNPNRSAATPEMNYTFSLYDADGLIIEKRGTTVLPPDSEYPIFEGRIRTGDRIPTQTFIDIEPPTLWLPAERGRDQFDTIDINRELLSSPNPRLDVVLENKALVEADSVEVVATIFDARNNALTSSRTFIDRFAPRSQRRVTFTWPEPIQKTLRSCEVPTDVVVAIDLSGSMNNDQDEPPEPISSVLLAAESFVERLQPADQVSVVTFATEALTNSGLSKDHDSAAATVVNLSIASSEETGSTNTGEALEHALRELQSPRANENARKVAVILTDGLATAPDEEPEAYALAAALALRAAGVEVYAIGLGQQVNMEFVRKLATNPTYAFQAIDRAEVDTIYRSITGEICEDSAAIISVVAKTDATFESLR